MPRNGFPNPPTVLLVIGSLQGGGAERQMSEMANYWAARSWKVVLVTWSGPNIADFYPLDRRVARIWIDSPTIGTASRSRIRLNMRRVAHLRRLLASLRPAAVLSFITESN